MEQMKKAMHIPTKEESAALAQIVRERIGEGLDVSPAEYDPRLIGGVASKRLKSLVVSRGEHVEAAQQREARVERQAILDSMSSTSHLSL